MLFPIYAFDAPSRYSRFGEKGFQVIYEKMMVMSSNCFLATNDHAAMWLIKVIPEKVSKIIEVVLSGKIRRTKMKRKAINNA
ncbi:MAG: hypothetical protein PHW73_07985 [Atribacterota bacterium]|nr:hypothetical protein [Atribacterota bacterium]